MRTRTRKWTDGEDKEDDMDEDEDEDVDQDEDEDADMDLDANMFTDLASMATSFGMDAETMKSAFLQYMLDQMLNGGGEGDEDDLEQDSDLDDDAKVESRIDSRFKIPPNFSREKLQESCGYCDKGDRKHARNLCCGSYRREEHSGVLEFMSWDFDPFLAARTKPIKGNIFLKSEFCYPSLFVIFHCQLKCRK